MSSFNSTETANLLRGNGDASILDKRHALTLQDPNSGKIETDAVRLTACKGSCGKSWCPSCFVIKGVSKKIADRLYSMNRRYVRTITLTIDRNQFDDGEQAYMAVRNDEGISQFIHNLSRTAGITVKQYVWILEWHKDGYPHWHLFIETDKKDQAGKIGGDILRKHWKYGSWVREGFIKSKGHWKQFTEYFENKGYFNPKKNTVQEMKDKTHQLELPEWAKNYENKGFRIRKWGSSCPKKKKSLKAEKEQSSPSKVSKGSHVQYRNKKISKRDQMTYGEVLKTCGQTTVCKIRRDNNSCHFFTYKIPYKAFRELFDDMGWYEPREGFVVQFKTLNQYLEFEEAYDQFLTASRTIH